MNGLQRERLEWRLAFLLLASYVYFFPRYADWSQMSRTAVILAVVNEGRLEIDTYGSTTGDYAEFNGHRYSDKAPGPALLGVPVYATVKILLDSPGAQRLLDHMAQSQALRDTLKPGVAAAEKVEQALAQTVATWVVVSIPAVLLGMLLFRLLVYLTGSSPIALMTTVGYALGTSAFPYAGALYSHQLVAALLFGSLYIVWRAREPGRLRLVIVGLLLGLSLISEYATALIVGGLGLYVLWTTRRLSACLLIGGGMIPPLLVMAIHNLLIFGTPLPVGYLHSTLWLTEHQSGFFSLSTPTFDAFWGITFSPYRGLFFMSPFLLLGIAGVVLLARREGFHAEAALCAWSISSFLVFNSASVMWFGGFAVGPRYLVPMLPFLAIGVGIAAAHWWNLTGFRMLFATLLGWSVVVTWSLTIGGQAFPDYDPNPLWNIALPALAEGNIARNVGTILGLRGWWSLIPLAITVLVLMLPVPGAYLLGLANREPAALEHERSRPASI